MLRALHTVLLAACALAPAAASTSTQLPRESAVPGALAARRVAASVEITETHFLARSHDADVAWVVFENTAEGFQEVRALPPGARLAYALPEGALAGMTIEVVGLDETGLVTRAGEVSCAALVGKSAFFTWNHGGSITGWISTHGGRALSRVRTRSAAAHVPVPLPSENTRRSKGRPIEGKKLPPV